jgi:DNA helicase HerA-like ATPase
MRRNKDTCIGAIANVTGNVISVKLLDNIKSTMPIIDGVVYRVGQIGSFLKIPLGYANLYGLVTNIGADAIPEAMRDPQLTDYERIVNAGWLSMVLVGEQIGQKFERGITQSPTTGDEVHIVTLQDLNVVYGGLDEFSSITVGNISVSESLEAKIDIDKLVTRHCAILGSTGSGKSNTVAVLLESIAKNGFKSSRILVIDPHGEYNEALKGYSKVYKVNADKEKGQHELFIPFWALPFDELLSIFSGNLTEANRDYVRSEIVERKIKVAELMKLDVSKESITADSPIPFSLNQLWFDLDDFERQTFSDQLRTTKTNLKTIGEPEKLISNEYQPASTTNSAPYINQKAKAILRFTDSIRNKLLNTQYNFLFNCSTLKPDLTGKIEKDIDSLIAEWLEHDKPITILDLSGIPTEIMTSISGALLKIVYDALFWGQNTAVGGKQQPLLMVLEEAHNYLRAGENSISSRTVQTIAKEGRKYGAGLLLVTQRPSELDETVLSQCGTLIALRMNNSKDRGHIASAVQDELQTMIDLLPSLRTGEGIISGEAVKIPSRVKFFKIANAPKSADPKVSEQWKKEKPNPETYKDIITYWRNQKIK